MHRRTRALPRQPRPKSPPRPNWSKSGGPAAARKSAGRVTIATAIAISDRRRAKARSRSRRAGRSRRRRQGRAASPRPARPQPRFPQAPHRCAAGRWRDAGRGRRWRAGPRAARGPGRRPPRERFQGKGRDNDKRPRQAQGGRRTSRGKFGGGGRDKGGGATRAARDKGGRDSGPSHRQYATSAAPRERDRPVDPNSPFAKLAALKEQLTANRKDQLDVIRGRALRQPRRMGSGCTSRPSQHLRIDRSGVAWSASVSINGCGTRGW